MFVRIERTNPLVLELLGCRHLLMLINARRRGVFRMRPVFVGVMGFLLALFASSADADLTFFGSARANAMGGAGLALVDRRGRNITLNPASLAILNRRVRLGFPGLGVRASGAASM